MATTTKPDSAGTQKDTTTALEKIHQHPPLIHLGKVKKKHAKKLKQGRGMMMGEVNQAYQQLSSTVEGDHLPLIISYTEKPSKNKKKKTIRFMGMKINRKKLKNRMKKSGIRTSFL